ncbi:MAG TPA: hypothetical protein VKU01_04280 [Bryobacteraceae bacterium]|nr:hypothetical protein [Bryobacteraceae bacterium]
MPQLYRVKTPFVAISPQAGDGFKSVALEPGSIISVEAGRTGLRSGLVGVKYEQMALSSYLGDIEDKAEPLEPQPE